MRPYRYPYSRKDDNYEDLVITGFRLQSDKNQQEKRMEEVE